MGGVLNHPTPGDMNAWMRDVERRLLTQERRSPKFAVEQALGTGAGKYATVIRDWNTEQTWQTGQFFSDVGSYNSPSSLKAWVGYVRSAAGVGGVQELVSVDGFLTKWRRSFLFSAGIPVFGSWQTDPVAGTRVSAEFTVDSGFIASGAESAILPVVHNLGAVPSVIAGHLEDGFYAAQFGWRVHSRTVTTTEFRFLNQGPNGGGAVLRFRMFY